MRWIFCLCLGVALPARAVESAPAADSTGHPGPRLFGLPLVFYSPDTRWGFGGGGIVSFGPSRRRSSVTFSVAGTQRRQWLFFFPFQLFTPDDRWRATGELSWYRYFYQYFGIGNGYPDNFLETYTAQYPRIRISALRRLDARGRHFAGLRYAGDGIRLVTVQPDSEIARGEVPGARGGWTSGLGPTWQYDSRDQLFFPRRGWFIEAFAQWENRYTGSAFRFGRYSASATQYRPVGRRGTLASQAAASFTSGEAPFYQLVQLGGNRRLRGYPDGKFRDRHLFLLQTELRLPLVWRFKGVAFAAAGAVFGTPGERLRWRPNAGVGLRYEFDPQQQLHLRLDYGIGEGRRNRGFYLTVGEAF